LNSDAEHWLWRLDAAAWLDAARVEIERGAGKLDHRRALVAHARRAAGMACNAVLVAWARGDMDARASTAQSMWGRSYIEHVHAIADGRLGPLDSAAQDLAGRLLAVPAVAPALVALTGHRAQDLVALLDDTRAFVALCETTVDSL
jgi:hypothetical protein